MGAPTSDTGGGESPPPAIEDEEASRELTSGGAASMDAAAAADRVAELAEAAVNDAKAEVAAAERGGIEKPLDQDVRG
jgi:hypothetical protein